MLAQVRLYFQLLEHPSDRPLPSASNKTLKQVDRGKWHEITKTEARSECTFKNMLLVEIASLDDHALFLQVLLPAQTPNKQHKSSLNCLLISTPSFSLRLDDKWLILCFV